MLRFFFVVLFEKAHAIMCNLNLELTRFSLWWRKFHQLPDPRSTLRKKVRESWWVYRILRKSAEVLLYL